MRWLATDDDEAVLIDLLNSAPNMNGVIRDELAEANAASAWIRAHGGATSSDSRHTLRDARSALQEVIRGNASPTVLAPFLDGVCYRPSQSETGIEWTLDGIEGRAIAVRAVLAWYSVHESKPGRLRPCANPECELFLVDHSKANTGRWCSMAVCGNRMKARRHYDRVRQP